MKKIFSRIFRGYTLIEMAVVLVIISILTSLVIQTKNIFLASNSIKAQMLTNKSPIHETPGLSLWIEPSLKKSFAEEESKNQNKVTQWKSVNSTNEGAIILDQSNANRKPTYIDKAINNIPALYFDGNDFLEVDISNEPISAPPLTIIAVVQAGNNNSEQILSSKQGGEGFEFGKGGNDKLTFKDHNGGSNFHFNYVFNDKPQILSFIYTQNGSDNLATLYNNGVLVGSYTNGHSQDVSTSLLLGSKQGTAQFWNGYIAEIIIFNRLLLEVERKSIEYYLAKKYEIELG